MPRKQVRRACINCRKSHAGCDDFRPCDRCSSRGLNCIDRCRKKRGLKKRRRAKVIYTPMIVEFYLRDMIISSTVSHVESSLDEAIDSYLH